MKRRWIVFIGKNLIRILLLTICISMVTFALMKASPIDPLQTQKKEKTLGIVVIPRVWWRLLDSNQ